MTSSEKGTRPPQLHVVDNFLNTDCIESFQRLLLREMEWAKATGYHGDSRQHYTLQNNFSNEELVSLDMIVKQKLHSLLESFYGQLLFIPKNISYNRWMIGDVLDCHNDSGHPNGELIFEKRGNEKPPVPISEHFNEFASVIYLTDDFEGGELFFNNFDYSIKPAAGTAVSFPANHFYIHGVTELTKGERVTTTLFWPGVKSICLSIAPEVYPDWWQRVANPELIWKVMPKEMVSKINENFLPPKI